MPIPGSCSAARATRRRAAKDGDLNPLASTADRPLEIRKAAAGRNALHGPISDGSIYTQLPCEWFTPTVMTGHEKDALRVAFRRLLSLSRFGSARGLRREEFRLRLRAFIENKWSGWVRSVFSIWLRRVRRIVTGPDFLDFLVTFRDITLLN